MVLAAFLAGSTACSRAPEPAATTTPPAVGKIIVDAKISKGTRFIFYSNNDWNRPERLPVVPGEWHEYVFSTPASLTSIRLDPTELPDGEAEIRAIRFENPSSPPGVFPVRDLESFAKFHAEVKFQSGSGVILIRATGPDMYIMYPVDPKKYSSADPSYGLKK